MVSLFEVPHIKYAISNGKKSKFKIDFELKKIGRKFGGIIMLSRILHILNNLEANYSILRLFRLCIFHLPVALLSDHLRSVFSEGQWAEERGHSILPHQTVKMTLLTSVRFGHNPKLRRLVVSPGPSSLCPAVYHKHRDGNIMVL